MYFKEATIPGVLSNCHASNYMHKISTSTCTYKCTHVLIMALRFRDLQNCVILSSCLILKHIHVHNYTLS